MSDLDKRLSVLETKVKNQEKRMQKQEDKSEQLNEISTYVRLQFEHNKNQDEKIDKMGTQFENITVVLDGINTSLLTLHHDVRHVKDKQDNMDNRVDGLEELREKEDEEMMKELQEAKSERKKFFLQIFSGVSVMVVGAFILLWLGLK